MGEGAYIGASGKARKVKSLYVGVGGKARKVKKAYIGIAGKARLFWDDNSILNWEESLPIYSNYGGWYDVVYGNGRFVTTTRGIGAYSISGDSWTSYETPIQSDYILSYGNGKFIAIASKASGGSTTMYSTDGVNWVSGGHMPEQLHWVDSAYGNGKFVAISSDGVFAYSTDGTSWERSPSSPIEEESGCVAYGNGKFVALFNYKGAYSTDGINWTAVSLPRSGYWKRVVYGNGKFVALDNSAAGGVLYSTDGINWSYKDSWYGSYNDIAYGNGLFVVLVPNYVDLIDAYCCSLDGIEWSDPKNLPASATLGRDYFAITYGNGKFVAVPREGTRAIYAEWQ